MSGEVTFVTLLLHIFSVCSENNAILRSKCKKMHFRSPVNEVERHRMLLEVLMPVVHQCCSLFIVMVRIHESEINELCG